MTAFEFIKFLGVIPMSIETPGTIPSNGELKRWFTQKSIIMNGARPTFNENVDFPVRELIFFPKSQGRKTTVI